MVANIAINRLHGQAFEIGSKDKAGAQQGKDIADVLLRAASKLGDRKINRGCNQHA